MLTLTTAGAAKYAAATNMSTIQYQDIRLGTGHLANPAAATALQAPISSAVFPVRDPDGQTRYTTVERLSQSEGVITFVAVDISADAYTATEVALVDTDGVVMAYHSVSTGHLFVKQAGTDVTAGRNYIIPLRYQAAVNAPTTWVAGAVLPATHTLSGVVELATDAEGEAGTDSVRAMTPASTRAHFLDRIATTAEVLAGTATDKVVSVADYGRGRAFRRVYSTPGTYQFDKADMAGFNWARIQIWGGGGRGNYESAAGLPANAGRFGAGAGGAYYEITLPVEGLDAMTTIVVGRTEPPSRQPATGDTVVRGTSSSAGAYTADGGHGAHWRFGGVNRARYAQGASIQQNQPAILAPRQEAGRGYRSNVQSGSQGPQTYFAGQSIDQVSLEGYSYGNGSGMRQDPVTSQWALHNGEHGAVVITGW